MHASAWRMACCRLSGVNLNNCARLLTKHSSLGERGHTISIFSIYIRCIMPMALGCTCLMCDPLHVLQDLTSVRIIDIKGISAELSHETSGAPAPEQEARAA